MSGTNDPFNFSQTDPNAPGLLGLPVSEWQNIARFGGNLASAANARTPQGFLANGPGLAGPLGAAVTGTMDQSRQNAVTRSGLASQGATTQGQLLQNKLTGIGIPAAEAQAALRMRALTEPGFLQNYMNDLMGTGGGASPSAAPTSLSPPGQQSQNSIPPDQRAPLVMGAVSGTPVPPAVLHGLIDYETGGTWDPNSVNKSSHAFGLQQSLPSTAADPGYGVPAISPNASPQEQAVFAAKYLAARGAASGVKDWNDPTQVASALAAYHGPQKDANGIDGQMYAQQVMRRAQTFSQPGPGSFQVAQAGNGPLAMPGQQPGAQPTPRAPAGSNPADPGQMSQDYLQQAAALRRRAMVTGIGSSLTGLPLDDPASLRQSAQDYQTKGLELQSAGPLAAAKSQAELRAQMAQKGFALNTDGSMSYMPGGPADPAYVGKAKAAEAQAEADASRTRLITTRAGVFDPVTGQDIYRQPEFHELSDASGRKYPAFLQPTVKGGISVMGGPPILDQQTPALAGPRANGGAPQSDVPFSSLPPNVQDARNKAYEDFAGKDADSYVSSKNTQGILAQMNEAADVLNKNPGFLSTGPTSPLRLGFASNVNDILRSTGLPTAFDPNTIGMWEELTKQTRTAGFELASHYEGHARQAASTIMNATSAVPSEVNSPVGFYKVSNGINEIAQQNADAHEYMQSVYDQQGDLSKANTDFYTKYPPQMYARRAISTTAPYPVKDEKELNRFLPGTYIKLPDGTLGQVPLRTGAPGIPDYIKQHQFAAPTAQTPTAVQQ